MNTKTKQSVEELCADDPDLVELREMKREEAYRLEHEQFRYYVPNGKCEQFINKLGSGENFIGLLSAANSVGKTAAGANIVAHIIWGSLSQNKYFDGPLYKKWPYPKRGRIASDPENLKINLIPTLREWLPSGKYTTTKGGKQYENLFKTDNGWEFDVMSYEQEAKEFESATLGWAWFDEPPTEAIFKATVARMRKGGIIFITETPLYAAWLYDHVIANPDTELAAKGQRFYVEAAIEDACKIHGIRGHLEHSHIERIIAEYSEEEKQARIYGKFQHLVGMRFKQFSRNIHVVKPFNIDPRNFSVYEALDTHPRMNDACVWIAVDRQGRKFVIDELWLKCQGGTDELAQRIKGKASQYRVERRVCEPAAFVEDQHTKQSLAGSLAKLGLSYVEATKLRTASDRRIEDALTYNKINLGDREEFIKAPELYFFETCQRVIWEMEHCRWDEWAGKAAENKDAKEKTIDKDDHFIESIGRIMVQEPQFIALSDRAVGDTAEPNYDPYAR
jgi:phage terminase large subunit-like protein